jgi:hypothetical protein
MHLNVTIPSPIHCQFDFEDLFFFPFLEIMVLRMATFYRLVVAQVNEEPPLKSSLDLTLTQHPRDEDPKLGEVRIRLKVEPPRAWYYCISSNFRTLVILL